MKEEILKLATSISRSQAGQLIEFLSPQINESYLKKVVRERLDKYNKWSKDSSKINDKLIPREIFEELAEILENEDISETRKFIEEVIEHFKLAEWERGKAKVLEKFNQLAKERGYLND